MRVQMLLAQAAQVHLLPGLEGKSQGSISILRQADGLPSAVAACAQLQARLWLALHPAHCCGVFVQSDFRPSSRSNNATG